MNHSVHDLIAKQFTRNLVALRSMLHKASAFAAERKFDESLFLQTRIAPDMFPFTRQVQMVSDIAKFAVARLSGKEAPPFADVEKTMPELIERIDKTIAFLQAFSPEDFKGYEKRQMTFSFRPGVSMAGADYLSSHVIPNFYFHLSMVYALLRKSGVPIGKNDFLGEQNWKKEQV